MFACKRFFHMKHTLALSSAWLGVGARRRGPERQIAAPGTVAAQRGFTLLEVSVVAAVILLLAVAGIPAISNYAIESRVPKVGEELARFIIQTKVNAPTADAMPYRGIDTQAFARSVRESGVLSVNDAGRTARVWHGLGDKGEVLVAEEGAGASFSLSLTRVASAACPAIASVLQRVSERITVAPDGGPPVLIKGGGTPYSPLRAQASCGKSNVFIFTVS